MSTSLPLNDNEENSTVLWAEIHRLRSEIQGPDGFETWKDAAIQERVKRVEREVEIGETLATALTLVKGLKKPQPEAVLEKFYFQHVDGGIYQFICQAKHSDTDEIHVTYKHLWPFDESYWVRPTQEWVDRFHKISEEEVMAALGGDRAAAQQIVSEAKAKRRTSETAKRKAKFPDIEQLKDKWKIVDGDCREGGDGIITYHVDAFEEGRRVSAHYVKQAMKEMQAANSPYSNQRDTHFFDMTMAEAINILHRKTGVK